MPKNRVLITRAQYVRIVHLSFTNQGTQLSSPVLARLATMVGAGDTARLDLSSEASGPLAASPGLLRMFEDDLEQLNEDPITYDAFHRSCRDAAKETLNWPTDKVN